MNLLLLSPDASGAIDGTLKKMVLNLPITDSSAFSDAAIVPIAWHPNFVFNTDLLKYKGKIIILDYLEMGWDAADKGNVLGRDDLTPFGHLSGDEWTNLSAWVSVHPPVLTFKRELHENDRSDTLIPAEFTGLKPIPPIQSKAEFEARPMEVFFSWGLSNPSRPNLHGKIFQNAHCSGIHVIDGWEQDGRFEPHTWATIHSPWYARQPIEAIDRWNVRAKLSVSLPGAGVKCFRSAESPRGSIMALHRDKLAWSHPWVHGENCIRIGESVEFNDLLESTRRDDLYDIYIRSQETAAKYLTAPYCRDYLVPAIAARL